MEIRLDKEDISLLRDVCGYHKRHIPMAHSKTKAGMRKCFRQKFPYISKTKAGMRKCFKQKFPYIC